MTNRWRDLTDDTTLGGRSTRGHAPWRGGARPKGGRRFLRTKKSRVIAIVTAVVLLACLAASGAGAFAAYQTYQQANALAKSGLQHFKNAEADLTVLLSHPFDGTNIGHARSEFAGAQANFTQLQQDLHIIPPMLTSAPKIGSKLASASRLVPIAIEAAQAGIIACDTLSILSTKLQNPLSSSTTQLTVDDLKQISTDFGQIRSIFNLVVKQVGALQPSDLTLDARLGPTITALRDKLPKIQQIFDEVQTFLTLAPQLLGVTQPASYLVEVLDSTELRPGGGFIGNYGLMTLTGGHMSGLHIQDVDLLDAPYKYGNLVIPLPPQYQWFAGTSPKWGFRDSNLEADFPTSAQDGESLYKQEGGPGELQGVIAITPWLVQNALRVTGQVVVPEFNQTVTADNMIQLIHTYQLTGLDGGPDNVNDPSSGTSLRKRFTGYLFQHFMEKVKTQFSQDIGKLVKLAGDSLRTKDIQVYFNATPMENVLRQIHLASTIDAPTTGDSLMAVDANIVASKINYYLKYTLTDQVTLDTNGNATHQTTLSYVWPSDPSTLVNSFPAGYPYLYIAYLRFYVPPGAQLVSQAGWQSAAAPSSNYGRTVWGGVLYVSYGSQTDITLTWTEPKVATFSGTTWTYSDVLQKQSGITVLLHYSLTMPACAHLLGAPPSGFAAPKPNEVSLNQPFINDATFTVVYQCS